MQQNYHYIYANNTNALLLLFIHVIYIQTTQIQMFFHLLYTGVESSLRNKNTNQMLTQTQLL